jgi:hypothetical protein
MYATPNDLEFLAAWLALEDRYRDEDSGDWAEHPRYTMADWALAVLDQETQLGYWAWVLRQVEEA